MKSFHGSQVVEITGKPAKPDFKERWSVRGSYYVKRDDGFHRVEFEWKYPGYDWGRSRRNTSYEGWQMREADAPVKLTTDGDFVWPDKEAFGPWRNKTKEQLESMHFYCISAKNEQGAVSAI